MFPIDFTNFSWHNLSTDHQELGIQISTAQMWYFGGFKIKGI